MEQHLLWAIAGIGTSVLAGTFLKMQGNFGPFNLRAVGIVLIAVLSSLIGITKPENITAAMGILGAIVGYLFGSKEGAGTEAGDSNHFTPSFGAGTHLGEFTRSTASSLQSIHDKLEKPRFTQSKTESFRWQSTDEPFIEKLNSLTKSSVENHSNRWVELCLEQASCLEKVQQFITSHTRSGWAPTHINFDNFKNGVHVNLTLERDFSSFATAGQAPR